jgi:hypothetical protein
MFFAAARVFHVLEIGHETPFRLQDRGWLAAWELRLLTIKVVLAKWLVIGLAVLGVISRAMS